jgi:hypothetical protein
VLNAAGHGDGDSTVANNSLGASGITHRMYAFHLHGALLVVTLIPLFLWTSMDHKKFTGKMAKALTEVKFHCLGKPYYGTKRL